MPPSGAGAACAQIIPHEASRTGHFAVDLVGRLPAMRAEDGGVRRLEPDGRSSRRPSSRTGPALQGPPIPPPTHAAAGWSQVYLRPGGDEPARVETALWRIRGHGKLGSRTRKRRPGGAGLWASPRASLPRFGVRAACSGVLPPRSWCGRSPTPSAGHRPCGYPRCRRCRCRRCRRFPCRTAPARPPAAGFLMVKQGRRGACGPCALAG